MLLFADLKISKLLLRYSKSRSETTTGFLWEPQTKTDKKDCFTKNLSPPTFLRRIPQTFKKLSLIYLKNSIKVFTASLLLNLEKIKCRFIF